MRPAVWRATRSRSTSWASGLSRVWTSRICRRPFMSGGGTKTWRSKRPGRSSALSSFSSMFEAAITMTLSRASKPSISTRSWLSVWSRSPEMSEPRCAPTASSSSMKMIAGAFSRASLKRRRIRAAPRPANISMNEEADWLKNVAPDSCATALASSVLPVPGGPCSRMPFGTVAPRRLKRFGSERNSTTSRSSSLVSSIPADVRPADGALRPRRDLLRLRPRHQLEGPPDDVDQQAHEEQRPPHLHVVLKLVPADVEDRECAHAEPGL